MVFQEENPAREHTIVRTAGKLIPFYFNKLPETKDSNVGLPSRWRRKKHNLKADESNPSEVLCPICSGPLNKLDLQSSKNDIGNCESVAEMFGASCCSSCRFQILPEDMSSIEHFHSLLPQPMFTRSKDCVGGDRSWLREQIKDCLLSDTEDDT
ncbi:hypothetical protein GIB67_000392 [Kingdonia uniflora]|uniref:Uncharacterized protein n=1 Tax=Kingdonia uniflora TaxID=39325 RepID=A0A7J7P5V5_9MAGN|nr:hypothetical protein GIB67_012500 [Kingdonia uniflora]KAF6174825.1 hypothetical protein GIB67_000392 [Kingdonia uniflora]